MCCKTHNRFNSSALHPHHSVFAAGMLHSQECGHFSCIVVSTIGSLCLLECHSFILFFSLRRVFQQMITSPLELQARPALLYIAFHSVVQLYWAVFVLAQVFCNGKTYHRIYVVAHRLYSLRRP